MLKTPSDPGKIRKVHLIFKTHLDVGFTDLACNVINTYFHNYFPRAIKVASSLRRRGGKERLIWTTGSWLISKYLKEVGDPDKRLLETAIDAGDIVWHAMPFTVHSELVDPSLFRFGLTISKKLDERFGRHTIAAKMTDVPGHTIGIVKPMSEAGIKLLHIGINEASTPVDVPEVFRWQCTTGEEIIVIYQKVYGGTVIFPEINEAMVFIHSHDNLGPPTENEVINAYARFSKLFPNSEVIASTLDAIALNLLKVKAKFTVITNDIGDTWIHGIASDPKKVAQYQELLRLLHRWENDKVVRMEDGEYEEFQNWLLLVPEHTWGLDIKTFLNDTVNYSNNSFNRVRKNENYKKVESSWQEKRDYIKQAIFSLSDPGLRREASAALHQLEPKKPDLAGFVEIDLKVALNTPRFLIKFNEFGALTQLTDSKTNQKWASDTHQLGILSYQTFSAADYKRFYQQYIRNKKRTAQWSELDFTKYGLKPTIADSQTRLLKVSHIYRRNRNSETQFYLELFPPEECCDRYGCPKLFYLGVIIPHADGEIKIDLSWFDKPASRLPEALWYSFQPILTANTSLKMNKMDEQVVPREVVKNGNRKLHCVNRGVSFTTPNGYLNIETLDAPLVAPGERSLLDFNNRLPTANQVHFLLYDNVWGTNFPMWYEDNGYFRFRLLTGKL